MSCVNGRLEDFEAAASVMKGQRVAEHVKFYIAAASDEIENLAKERGYWQPLLDAGAIRLPPGCGACIGLGEGTLADGEVGISATNRNFKGRMGSRDSFVYLASPLVVAASAIAGKIASPETVAARAPARPDVAAAPRGGRPSEPEAQARVQTPTERRSDEATRALAAAAKCREVPRPTGGRSPSVEILEGFPTAIEGELLLIPKDNLNTDGIYGKDYTYKELPPGEMAKVAMENYDPAFQQIAREGDLLVGGYNFGSGSSREQAATALKYRGLQMIIAGSFSQTYKRNAFNNGYVCIECPQLVDDLRAAFKGDQKPTIRSGWQATVDFTKSRIEIRARSASEGPGSDEATKRRSDGGEDVAAAPRGGREGEAPAEPRAGGVQSSVLQTYAFSPLGTVAQELVVKGGFEAVIRDQLASL